MNPSDFAKNLIPSMNGMVNFRNGLDRLYSDFFKIWTPSDIASLPPVNLSEKSGTLIISLEIPGVAIDDLFLRLDGNALTITGDKVIEENSKDHNWFLMERRFGSFHRTIELPFPPSDTAIDAELESGVLTIKIAKMEGAQKRIILFQFE